MKNARKAVLALLAALGIAALLPLAAHADIGPKPSVEVDFTGLEGRTFYCTLLFGETPWGPNSVPEKNPDGTYVIPGYYEYGAGGQLAFQKFAEYQDPDGFAFAARLQDCTQTQRFDWNYYPPDTFKILLYFPKTDTFLCSGVLTRYAFDSSFTAAVGKDALRVPQPQRTGPDEPPYDFMQVTKQWRAARHALAFTARFLLTFALELAAALLFGLRGKRVWLLLVLVNLATQLLLNIALQVYAWFWGTPWLLYPLVYALLELCVFLVEAIVYAKQLPGRSARKLPKWLPWGYALAANGISFAAGLALEYWLPVLTLFFIG